jgi:hypothetical protein
MIYKTHSQVTVEGIKGLTFFELSKKYKFNHNIFFETGTHHGDGILKALDLGFNKILSVEIDQTYFLECYDKFIDQIIDGKVHLFFGDSNVWMNHMLKLIKEPALFWLDGHPDGIDGNPLWEELESIKNHPIKNHTILIDDIPIYFDPKQVESKLLEINPNYTFIYENALNENNGNVYENYQLAAYISK